jgi:tetratricopeptide (TPR) repeat protein
MTTAVSPGVVRKWPRRAVLLGLVVAVIVAAVGVGWRAWHRTMPPALPEINLEGADPEVVSTLQAARRHVRENPTSVAAWGRLGRLLRASDYREAAVACFAEARRLDPRSASWPYLQGEALAQRDPEAALPHLERAEALCGGGPESVAVQMRLAGVHMAMGHYEEAESHLRRAEKTDPENLLAQLRLGLVAYARGDLASSRDHLLRCRESPFTRQKACAQLAAVYERLGDAADAGEYSKRAAAAAPDRNWPDPFLIEITALAVGRGNRLREVEQLESQKRYAEAVARLRELLAEDPSDQGYVGLGKNLAQLGHSTAAEEALRTALRLSPDNVLAYYYLSQLAWARGEQRRQQQPSDPEALADFRAAADYAGRALARKQDHALARMILGRSLKRLDKAEEAMAALREAVRCGPELSETHLALGELLAESGQEPEARSQLEQAVQLADPDDSRPRAALERLGRKKP